MKSIAIVLILSYQFYREIQYALLCKFVHGVAFGNAAWNTDFRRGA